MKGQVGIEAVALISVMLILFTVVIFQVIQNEVDAASWSILSRKEVVCHKIANLVTEVYSAGPNSEANLSLLYKYNVTFYGTDGLINVGSGANSISCNTPYGISNETYYLTKVGIKASNVNGLVVVEDA